MVLVFKRLIHNKDLLKEFVRRDLHSRYAGSVMGIFWSVIHPIVTLLIYTFLFSVILKVKLGDQPGMTNFALYLFCGMCPWMAFQDAVQRSTSSIVDNSNLIKNMVFPSKILPLYLSCSSLITGLINLGILTLAILIIMNFVSPYLILLPLLLVFQLLFALGLGLLTATVNIFFRDTTQIIGVFLTVWMFLTPIFYPESLVPPRFMDFYMLESHDPSGSYLSRYFSTGQDVSIGVTFSILPRFPCSYFLPVIVFLLNIIESLSTYYERRRSRNLSKKYEIYAKPSHRLLEFFSMGSKKYHSDFWALKDVNFAIEKGGAVGVIGPNGSGKSTLLKLINGITVPSKGEIKTNGRIASLIELGMGFHPEFSGRSNVHMNAALMGLSPEEIEDKFESILEFSELRDFIDYPIKTYSSGMQVRLAFSVAIHINPEILLVDEALSVGDALFQHRCLEKIRDFHEKGITIVFVSHDLNTLKALCPQTILIDRGQFVEKGETGAVLDHYMELVARQEAKAIRTAAAKDPRFSESTSNEEKSNVKKGRRYGSYEAKVTQIKMFTDKKEEKNAFVCGDSTTLEISLEVKEPIKNLTVGMLIRDRNGVEVYGANTFHKGIQLENLKAGESVTASFQQNLPLKPADYFVTVALHSVDTHYSECFDWWNDAFIFSVLPSLSRFSGAFDLDSKTSVVRDESVPIDHQNASNSETQKNSPENHHV